MAASGLTFLQIVNRILERLRESTVAAYDENILSKLISQTANQVAAEIQDAWYWHAQRETFTVSAVAGTTSYSLTGSGMNAVVLDGWNTTTNGRLTRGTVRDFDAYFFGSSSLQTGSPDKWLISGLDSNNDLTIDIMPSPSGNNTLKLTVYVPQAEFSANGTIPLVPQNVLIEETLARVRVERGEEEAPRPQPGETFILKDLLASAVSRDQGKTDDSEMDWEPE